MCKARRARFGTSSQGRNLREARTNGAVAEVSGPLHPAAMTYVPVRPGVAAVEAMTREPWTHLDDLVALPVMTTESPMIPSTFR